VVAIAGRLFPQNAADDPGGWTKARGMTQEQIKEAFPETTEIQEMNEMHLGLSMSVINHRKLAVAFTFNNNGGLSYAHLIDQKTLVGNDGTETPLVRCASCAVDGLARTCRR